MVKAGFAGDDAPRAVFLSIDGRPRFNMIMGGMATEFYVSDEAIATRNVLPLNYPIVHGIVTSWDHIEKIWQHTCFRLSTGGPKRHR